MASMDRKQHESPRTDLKLTNETNNGNQSSGLAPSKSRAPPQQENKENSNENCDDSNMPIRKISFSEVRPYFF